MRYLIVSTLVVIQLTLLPVVAGVTRHQTAAMLEKHSAASRMTVIFKVSPDLG